MNRRQFLASTVVTGTTAVSGCLGETEATKLEQAPKNAIKISTKEETPSKDVYDISGTLKESQFDGMRFYGQVGFTVKWDIDVTKGGAIDVWVMEEKEQEPFMNKKDVMYSRDASRFGVKSGKGSGKMSPGKYVIIYENSGAYKTEPKGTVDFDSTVQLLFE